MSAPSPHYMDRDDRTHSKSRLSAAAVESADVVLDPRKMYAVEWRDGATFGFTVTPVNSDHGTVLLLARRTARREQLEAAGLADVVPGDLLVAVGDEKVYHLGAEHTTTFLRSVQKPVRLTLQLSPYGNQAKQLPDLAPNEYHYLWETGPLGIVLTLDLKSKLPMVKRLSDKANEVVRRDVEVSDQLIYANDVPTSEYSMDEVMSILREMPKPVLLRFRKQLQDDHLVELPELAENEYEFLWDYGPLGLVIGMSRSGLPFVRSFTGLGTSRQLNLVQEDDEIIMVNDKSARDEGFREIMQYLMNVPKPAVLRFRRKIRGGDERASQAARASAKERGSTTSSGGGERPPTVVYQSSPVPECVGPLSPMGPLSISIPNYNTANGQQEPPLSPQIRVSLDRSRFRSVSSERISAPGVQSRNGSRASASPVRESVTRASGVQAANAVAARQTIPSAQRISDGSYKSDGQTQYESAASPQSSSESVPEDRETAILPPDPMSKTGDASRSSIFTFRFDEGSELMTTSAAVAAAPAKQRRLSSKTGSMPPEPVAEAVVVPDELTRSQSVRPISRPQEMASPVTAAPRAKQRESIPTAEVAALVVAEAGPPAPRARPSNPAVETAELVAEPVATGTHRGNQRYVDTADLVADPTSAPRKAPADNQIPTPPKPVKPRPTPGSNKFEDTADLVADPAPKAPVKKAFVDTADLVAEPSAKVEKTVTRSKTVVDTAELMAEPVKAEKTVARSKPIVNTADLVAEPAPVKKATPAKKQYEDTAELFAEPTPAPSAKKQYVDTAGLVATPASNGAEMKPKKQYIDTAELFAEPPAPAPAPKLAAAPVAAPAPVPVKKPVAPVPAPAPVQAVPAPTPGPAEGQDFFTVDPAAFYTIQWTDGPFGSTVREADSTTGPIMLITKRTGKQTCAGLRRIAVGDILVRIGDKDVSSMGFDKATRYLRKVVKPVPLTFQAID